MIKLCQGDILMSTQFNGTEKTFARDVRDFKSNLKLDKISKNTFIVAVVIANDDNLNSPHVISSRNGTPVNNVVHNLVNDCFHLDCYDHYFVGVVSVSYNLSIKNIFGWEVLVPLPESVVRRHLSSVQKKKLKGWLSSLNLSNEQYELTYLQVTGCH
jgi:hypothetical protein